MKKIMLGALVLMACQNLHIKAGDMSFRSERMQIPEPKNKIRMPEPKNKIRMHELETQVLEDKIRELGGKLGIRSASSDRVDFMKAVGRCKGFEEIARNNDYVAAGVLAKNHDKLNDCPVLFGLEEYLNRFEKCMVRALVGNGKLRAKPMIGFTVILDHICRNPEKYPDVYEGLDDDAGSKI